MNSQTIRNFAIIAHVDHGKSTLADRFLELTHTVEKNKHEAQMLDRNPISRERGITIKLAPVSMRYKDYLLNLVDTPGHVDFSYEVERTLASVEGVILLVDATKGIQAQTIAHAYKALAHNLAIIPVVNKIDMDSALVEKTVTDLATFLGVPEESVYKISAKSGIGVEQLLNAVIAKIPPPVVSNVDHSRALIFDSYYDPHRGVIAFVRLFEGSLQAGKKVRLCQVDVDFEVQEVGIFTPDLLTTEELSEAQIGYVVTNMKNIHDVRIGDTIADKQGVSLEGYKEVKPMVFASVFPTDPDDFPALKKALEKLYLNDAALQFEALYSAAFGAGYRVGFLGLLHADVSRERLEREYGQSIILTPPKVDYKSENGALYEPIVTVTIVTPEKYMGVIMNLCEESRGIFLTMDNVSQLVMIYEIPLAEILANFFDRLKTVTSGYASVDWEFKEYRKADISKLEILINSEAIEEFSDYVVDIRAPYKAREITSRLKDLIPRQQFEVRIQARYDSRFIASERISPFRKDVTAKLYGGDRTRKDKLLNKQKEGKKKMKQIGKVEIPKEAFISLFSKK
ncbi:MAG: GTP-binding protein [Candidatus Roizmanbacteria bacterium]|nr:GTP-binding protein [Candidatus Roizmanbacteria bacterium]